MKWQACHFTYLRNGWREQSNFLNTKSKCIWRLFWRTQHRNWLSCQEGAKRRESCQTKCLWVALFLKQIIAKYWWLHWFPRFWAALCESIQEGRLGRNEANTSLFSCIADFSGCMLANHKKTSSACSCSYTKVVQVSSSATVLSTWKNSCVTRPLQQR